MEEPYSAWIDDLMDEIVPGEDASIRAHGDSENVVAIFADARYALTEGLREVEEATGDGYGYQDMFEADGYDERVKVYGFEEGHGTGKRGSAVDVYLDQLRDCSEMRLDEAFTVAEEELSAMGYEEPGRMLREIAEDGVVEATMMEIKPGYQTVRMNEELRRRRYTLGDR